MYRLTSKLGEGGMGAVYRATDTKLNRDVAIKILPPALAGDGQYMAASSANQSKSRTEVVTAVRKLENRIPTCLRVKS